MQVSFTDGTSEEFDLVIGADGIRSRTRELMFGASEPKFSNIRIQFGESSTHGQGRNAVLLACATLRWM